MRKVISIFLLLTLLVSFCGCGNKKTAAPVNTNEPAGNTEIQPTSITAPPVSTVTPPDSSTTPSKNPMPEKTESTAFAFILADNILSDAECKQIDDKAQELSQRSGCGVYIAIFNDMAFYGANNIESFAEQIFNQWKLGLGEERDAIMLVMSMADRDYDLCAHGSLSNSVFTDYGKEALADAFLDNFRNDDWFGGIKDYIQKCEELLSQGNVDNDAWDNLESMGKISTESGVFYVSITLPADYVGEGVTQAKLDANAGETYTSGKLNADGSVTYKMTKKQHKAMLDGITERIESSLQEMVDSPDNAFTKITHNKDFTSFDAFISSESLGMAESFMVLAFYTYGGMYTKFTGKDAENICVNFYSSSGKLINTANSENLGG